MHPIKFFIPLFCALGFSLSVTAQEAFFIEHKASQQRMQSCAESRGEWVRSAPQSSKWECVQWQRIPNGDYFHLKNIYSGLHLFPTSTNDDTAISVQPNTWTGHWAQWSFEPTDGGYGFIVNRGTGKQIFLTGQPARSFIRQAPRSWTGDYSQWKFTPVKPEKPMDQVVMTESFFTWDTFDYTLNPDFSMANFSHSNIVQRTYSTWIIENKYLKITLLPEFGGRILSMINKSTGNEELYQNPVGTPYLIGSGIFYYDWLMVMGGIFPTVPDAEHGKAWNREWDLEILEESDSRITVAMSYLDNDAYDRAPGRYIRGASNIKTTFVVSLSAGRAAVDTQVVLENTSNIDATYEYWTNTTLAPGSQPGNSRATDGFEMVAPIDSVSIDYGIGVSAWEDVKWFAKHTGEGIAYASPNMQGENFWGAINHDVEEGIFRIADNTLTPGLKIWTFGYDSVNIDPYADGVQWHRPAIELWAGVTNRFFERTTLPANTVLEIDETYASSVGLSTVTHANTDILVELSDQQAGFNFFQPEHDFWVTINRDGEQVFSNSITPNLTEGNLIPGDFSQNTEVSVYDNDGNLVISINN